MKTLLLATSLTLCIAYAQSQPQGNRGLYFNGTGAYVEVEQAHALPFTGASDFACGRCSHQLPANSPFIPHSYKGSS